MIYETRDRVHYIYRIINKINGKIYIGQSVDTIRRWYDHKRDAAKQNPPMLITKAIKKYGNNNFDFEVIACCKSWKHANELETILVAQYHSLVPYGYNMTLGGYNAPKTESWKLAVSKTLTSNVETFLERAYQIHGDRYNYSESIYISAKTKIKIICKEHGAFYQTPDKHLNREQGCIKCGFKIGGLKHSSGSADRFIEQSIIVHGDKYDYSEVDYIKSSLKVKIICPKHGVWQQTPNNHLHGFGCPKCGRKVSNANLRI